MKKEILGKCPVCNSDTEITRISCRVCNTTIEGNFSPCKFCKLSSDQKLFIDAFIKCRGNIKEVEKDLGISYPTVKSRLEDVVSALDYKAEPQNSNDKRKEVLKRIDSGEISVEDAVSILKGQK